MGGSLFLGIEYVLTGPFCLILKNLNKLLQQFKQIFLVNALFLSHLFMIDIYKYELDETDINLVTNEFIEVKESKIATFGLLILRICLL